MGRRCRVASYNNYTKSINRHREASQTNDDQLMICEGWEPSQKDGEPPSINGFEWPIAALQFSMGMSERGATYEGTDYRCSKADCTCSETDCPCRDSDYKCSDAYCTCSNSDCLCKDSDRPCSDSDCTCSDSDCPIAVIRIDSMQADSLHGQSESLLWQSESLQVPSESLQWRSESLQGQSESLQVHYASLHL